MPEECHGAVARVGGRWWEKKSWRSDGFFGGK
jgi:hypothetical protein